MALLRPAQRVYPAGCGTIAYHTERRVALFWRHADLTSAHPHGTVRRAAAVDKLGPAMDPPTENPATPDIRPPDLDANVAPDRDGFSILNSSFSLLAQASWAVFQKDLRAELRTRYALNAVALFAVSTVVALSLGVGFLSEGRNADLPLIHAALLWVAVLFAAFTGLARAFVQEEEARTAAALRLAASPIAVYLGKLLFNLLLLLLLGALVAVLFVVLLHVQIKSVGLFAALMLAGSLGL